MDLTITDFLHNFNHQNHEVMHHYNDETVPLIFLF